jgi:hypothetical protein
MIEDSKLPTIHEILLAQALTKVEHASRVIEFYADSKNFSDNLFERLGTDGWIHHGHKAKMFLAQKEPEN